jgi:hypothetical protein
MLGKIMAMVPLLHLEEIDLYYIHQMTAYSVFQLKYA